MEETTDKELHINIIKRELSIDIKNRAYAIARSTAVKGDNPDRDDVWLIDIDNESYNMNHEIAVRSISFMFHHIQHVCRKHDTVKVKNAFVADDMFRDPERYDLVLEFDDGITAGTGRYIRDLVHELIVYKVLYEWCLLVAKDHLDVLGSKLDDLKEALDEAITDAEGKCKERPYYPF